MTLADLIAADAALFINTDDFARSVVYRSASGVQTTLNAVVYESESASEDNNGVQTIVRTRAMTFAASYTQIDSTGVVVIDTVEWAVTPTITTDGVLTTVLLKRFELHEQTRPNLRRS